MLFPFKDGAFVDLNGQIVSNSFEVQGYWPWRRRCSSKYKSGTLARINCYYNNGNRLSMRVLVMIHRQKLEEVEIFR